jgi:hypothetical protein
LYIKKKKKLISSSEYLEWLVTIPRRREDGVLGIDGACAARDGQVEPQLLRVRQVGLAAEAAHGSLRGESLRHSGQQRSAPALLITLSSKERFSMEDHDRFMAFGLFKYMLDICNRHPSLVQKRKITKSF